MIAATHGSRDLRSANVVPQGRLSELDTIVVVDLASGRRISPVPFPLIGVFRRAAQLVLSHTGDVSAETGVVLQGGPRQRVVVVSQPEKAAKAEHGVRDAAAGLVDHHTFDRADLGVISAVDGGAFDLVASDQVAVFTFVE